MFRSGGRGGQGMALGRHQKQFQRSYISKFSWGAPPDPPYLCSYYCTIQFPVQQILYKNHKTLQYSPHPPLISRLLWLPPLDKNPG